MARPLKKLGLLVFFVLLFGGPALVLTQRQAIYDWFKLRDYQAPAAIAQLADETTMTPSSRRLFYVHHPELLSRTTFNQKCTGFGEQTIVLGCYVSSTGIYLFGVNDKRLEGVEQVTAAHELLHAAYDRLNMKERARVDRLTKQTFENLSDKRIKDTIASYRRRDASVVANELHSILGTEVRELPQELEEYYSQYFTNRAKVVGYSEHYEKVLTERRSRLTSLEAQITGLAHEIELQEKTLSVARDQLHQDRPDVDTQAEVNAYNARVSAYNAQIQSFNALIDQYNGLVAEYKQNALEQRELYKSLDSKPTL